MKTENLNWLTKEDGKLRSNGIGASDASYLLDVNKWVDKEQFRDGPHQLFEMKKGRHSVKQNRAMAWGKVLEHHVVDIEYPTPMGASVWSPELDGESTVCSGVYDFLRCSPDRFVLDRSTGNIMYGLEIKTSWAYRDDWMLDAYMPQLQWSMLVTGIDCWHLFGSMQARKPDHKYRNVNHIVEADPIMQAEMMDLALKFWHFVEESDYLPEDWREQDPHQR